MSFYRDGVLPILDVQWKRLIAFLVMVFRSTRIVHISLDIRTSRRCKDKML
jgi:hypothetical protein